MSILELATQVCTPRNLEALGRVAQLHVIEREMLLGQLKLKALGRLSELTDEVSAASADEVRAAEVMRKACVDILRYGNGAAPRPPSPPSPRDDAPEPINEEKILEALERLGQEENQYEPDEPYEPYEPRTQASGSSSPSQASGSSLLSQASGSVEPSPPDKAIRTGKMPMPLVEVPSDTHLESCLRNDSRSRNGPGARASGSYSSPPQESPPESPSESPPESPPELASPLDLDRNMISRRSDNDVPLLKDMPTHTGETPVPLPEKAITHTGKMPVPFDVRRPISRTPNNDGRILFDDAHPP